jgi:hypothetical protein
VSAGGPFVDVVHLGEVAGNVASGGGAAAVFGVHVRVVQSRAYSRSGPCFLGRAGACIESVNALRAVGSRWLTKRKDHGGGIWRVPSRSIANEVDFDLAEVRKLCPGHPSYSFADWGKPEVAPRPGIYTVWDTTTGGDERFVYVGMAGRGVLAPNAADVADTADPDQPKPKRKNGLLGRLHAHESGRRSGDQFCVYVCDYFVVPELTRDRQKEIAAGEVFLDDLTQDYIHESFSYRFIYLPDGKTAEALERKLRKGDFLPELGKPFLNPLPARKKRRAKR